jgi:hypothetical protein
MKEPVTKLPGLGKSDNFGVGASRNEETYPNRVGDEERLAAAKNAASHPKRAVLTGPGSFVTGSREERAEGIVLKAINHKDQERIITLFTRQHGLMSLIVKRIKNYMMLTTPLCHAEFIYTKGRSELYRFQDGTVIDGLIQLRNHLRHLQAAGDMVQAILQSQLPGKPSPKLYELLLACLKALPEFPDPLSLTLAFRLKLLAHEGVIHQDQLSPDLKELIHARSFQKIRAIKVDQKLKFEISEKFNLLH